MMKHCHFSDMLPASKGWRDKRHELLFHVISEKTTNGAHLNTFKKFSYDRAECQFLYI